MIGSAGSAKVRIALANSQETRALLGVAAGLTATAGEAVLTCNDMNGCIISMADQTDAQRSKKQRRVQSELHWQNFSQKFCAMTQGQLESHGCPG